MLTVPAGAQDTCAAGAEALGVSRTVEIDPSTGPRFGSQYKEHELLADGEVVLTFDDGPSRIYTKPILDALDAQCTKATFFLVGQMAVADPEMVQEYARRGHTVGTHTWSHANLRWLSPPRARAQIELGFSAVQQAMGKPIAPFFRFPYLSDGKWLAEYLRSRKVAAFSIDVDSKDYLTHDPSAVHRKVMAQLAREHKGIILFHDIQPSTARALPGILAALKAKGYRVVHLKPKDPVATVAEFDTEAHRVLAARSLGEGRSLAKRALTWPAADIPKTERAAAQASEEALPAARTPRSQVYNSGQKIDWAVKLFKW
jgi:peptidoglycan/xylan/chitin deacetylase (PgdA/CDA1 family)